MSLFRELSRRNVYRVTAVYLLVSWIVLQVADVLMSFLPLPQWAPNLIFVLLMLGFPIALVLAWSFEITPDGVRREIVASGESRGASRSFRKLDFVLLAGLIGLAGYAIYTWSPGTFRPQETPARSQIDSIVVLPLKDLTNDPDQAFFVAGMHEALITELSKVKALRVISRTSAMAFKDSAKPLPEIARELNVAAVVEGSVLRAGDTVRVTAQLIEAATDRHLWAENYDRPMTDILALYGVVAREIVDQIRVELTADEASRLTTSQTVEPAVYEKYLQARYMCENWSPHEMAQGIEVLRNVVRMDANYAAGHAELALCLQYAAFFNYLDPLEVTAESEVSAERAIQLDPELAEAYVALAGVRYYLEYRRDDAEQLLRQALELNPGSVKALIHLSWLLGESGRPEEALPPTFKAIEHDPLSTTANHALGQVYNLAREFDKAVEAYEQALALDPGDPVLHFSLALAHANKGEMQPALEYSANAVEHSGRAPLFISARAYILALMDLDEEAGRLLEELRTNKRTAHFDLAVVFLGLGEYEKAIDELELAYENRNSQLVYISRDKPFDPVRADPRFQALLEKLAW